MSPQAGLVKLTQPMALKSAFTATLESARSDSE